MDPFTAESISQTLFEINKSMKNIDKTLKRIADALEKQTAPSVDGKELFERIKGDMNGERVRSCWIYKEPLMRWIEERK